MKPIIKSTYEDFARNTSIHGFQNTIDRSKFSKNLNNVTTEDDVKEALPILILFTNANFAEVNTSRDYLWLKQLLNVNGYSELDAFKEISMSCEEMLVKCKWEEREYNCSRLFTETFTDQSRCCSFNSDLTKTRSPIHTKYFGQYMGLKVITNNSNDDDQFSLIRAKGITVALHYNDDYPVNAKYRVISSSYITYFQITGTSIEDSEEVQMLPVDQRECVYEHEVKLKYFNGYSDNNCLTEYILT
ncbi:PREDICTED: sodium channel protein Nach-like [Nicrophorus vespilloides]|uniref:Sodium channel protein Nach-like n=1 Tax=Nicrophorus vespilloides TaxID=110193 RepID=A0ABM1MF97_NICVS|nr:PREDICTED: sodium channel protein Nach-like [Nicrophorus vespilloides]